MFELFYSYLIGPIVLWRGTEAFKTVADICTAQLAKLISRIWGPGWRKPLPQQHLPPLPRGAWMILSPPSSCHPTRHFACSLQTPQARSLSGRRAISLVFTCLLHPIWIDRFTNDSLRWRGILSLSLDKHKCEIRNIRPRRVDRVILLHTTSWFSFIYLSEFYWSDHFNFYLEFLSGY